jgi:hypothetical protein
VSGPNNRRGGDRVWCNPSLWVVLEDNRRLEAAIAAVYREFSMLQARAWLLAPPAPDQQCGTSLLPPGTVITKRSTGVARFYARTHRLERRTGHLLGEALVNCNTVPPPALRRAFEKVGRLQLRQMRNPDLRGAGFILDSDVSDDGIASVRFVVTDEAAMQKLATRTYTGLVLTIDDAGDITDLSLIDSPVDFVGEFAKRSGQVIAKVFTNESLKMSKLLKKARKMSKRTGYPIAACADALRQVERNAALEKQRALQLAPSAQRALSNYDTAVAAVPGAPDQAAAKAQVSRALGDIGVELVKAARSRPIAIGADAMVNFLRHGRP